MTRIRIVPKWLSFLLPLSLSLAVLTTVGCGGDDPVKPPPPPVVKSSEAGIASLTLTGRKLEPSWTSTVKNYGAEWVYTDVPSVTLTVTLKDTKGKLFINNTAATSGQGRAITLSEGTNTINVATLAEDGHTADYTTITVKRVLLNTRVYVLDSIGGSFVTDAVVTLKDVDDNVLVENLSLTPDKQGKLLFSLNPAEKYNIYAKGYGRNASCFANFDPTRESLATLICLRGNTTTADWTAPVITDISVGTSNSDAGTWNTLFNKDSKVNLNYIRNTRANLNAVKVTAISKNQIGAFGSIPQYEIFPMRINLDAVASENTGGATGAVGTVVENSVTHPGGYYRTTHRFTTPLLQSTIVNANHWVDIVVHDVAGNRCEQRFYITVTDAAPTLTGDANLSNVTPTFVLTQAQTFGVSLALPATNPGNFWGATIQSLNQFRVRPTGETTDLAIRGYVVERSAGNANNFKKVMTVNYAATATGNPFQFVDRDADLEPSVTYYYRVRAFNGNPANAGYSRWSAPWTSRPLDSFTTTADYIVSDKIWPTIKFKVTNSALVKDPNLDRMRFLIYLKDVNANYPLFYVPFYVNYTERAKNDPWGVGKPSVAAGIVTGYSGATGAWSGPTTGLWEGPWQYAYLLEDEDGKKLEAPTVWAWTEDDGTVVIDTNNWMFQELVDNVASYLDGHLMPGATYEWSVFGNAGGIVGVTNNIGGLSNSNVNAAYFFTEFNPGTATPTAYSYGSNLWHGFSSPNGFFRLTISPNAK